MASYKSQYPPQRRAEDRIPTTRLPQRSITPTVPTGQNLISSQSKLQKRRPSRDEQVYPSRSLTGHKEAVRTVSSRHEGSGRTAPLETQRSRNMSSRPAPPDSKSYLPKLEVPANTRTPSLASGSSASTIESPRSNVLRRKQTTVGVAGNRLPSRTKDEPMSYQDDRPLMGGIPGGYKDPFSETVLGISLPSSSSILAHSDPQLDIYGNGLYDCEIGPTDILAIPTPQYALSATPSTRYSESPGAFSISSTATSMTSYSPKAKPSLRTRQTSPLQTRPPVTRHKTPDESAVRQPHSLSTVRESSTSSSSASTVVADVAKYKERQSPHQLASLPQSPPAPQAARRQAPPEFAHLADRSPAQLPAPRRPSRPSRDGTPELSGLRGPSPIIQSNMMNMPVSHRRTSSNDSKNMPTTTARSKINVPAKPSSRLPSPSPAIARPPTRGTTPDLHKERDGRRSSTLPTPPAPAPSPSKASRFGFFSRRTKTDPIPSTKPDNKLQRKGPAAGTGHEGYGRYSVRGRSGSSISANSIGRSASAGTTRESLDQTPSTRKSSVTSTTSSDMDDFYANRLAPVIIRGAGSSLELSRSPEPMNSSSTLDLSSRSGVVLKNTTSNTSQTSLAGTKPTLLPSAMPDTVRGGSPMKKITLGRRRPSESDDDTKRSFLPSLTSRRVSRTLQSAQGATPEPQSKLTGKNKAEKDSAKPSKRWNFFQRAHAVPREPTPAAPVLSTAKKMPTSRSVAHYALMDQSGLNMNDIEQLMKEARDDGNESALSDDDADKKERMQSMLLPPKPIIPTNYTLPTRSASPKVFLRPEVGHGSTATQQPRGEHQQEQQQQQQRQQQNLSVQTDLLSAADATGYHSQGDITPVTDLSPPSSPLLSTPHLRPTNAVPVMPTSAPALPPAPIFQDTTAQLYTLPPQGPPPTSPPPRPSRLAQVGRIPQVISSRNKPRRPSSQSFSRPFAADQPPPSASPPTSFDNLGPVAATANAKESYPILHGLSALSHGSAIATMSPLSDESRRSEFFKFPSRKDSEVSYSSGSGIWSFAPVTASAAAPMSAYPFSEDELWNEYDDLLDEVLSEGGNHSQHASLEVQPLKTTKAAQSSALLGCPPPDVTNPSIHLRRSRLLAVLHSTQSPTSDVSFSEFISGYGEKKISVIDPVTGRLSLPSSPRQSVGSNKRSTRSSLPASLSTSARQSKATIASRSSKDRDSASTNRYRDTRLMEIAETQADGLLSMANLRFGALMTSKWLSFGRVLFSPIHFDLKDPSEDRVLVIDGLGKDWSYYCALTYPEATIYNIGPEPSATSASATGSSEPWSTLRNHRHISHKSLSNALPFPMSFFASVVLRFPSALPSSVHRFVLSEVKRVLRPGGYLEFSVLDMDLVNMGNRARRAVRGLKVKMQAGDENTSLRNISDEIMAGIGRKGFVECNRCVVGVPVAGQLPNLDDVKSGAATRKGSTASSSSKTNSTTAKAKKPETSFSDLLSGSSISESGDNGITDMVARVGRWWYSRCYESILLPESDETGAVASGDLLKNSIWRDESLISECEKRGTSFKLLIGYAQKPEIGVRRTVSV